MPLAITDDHRELGGIVRSFATSNELRAAVRTALNDGSADVTAAWQKIAAQGWLGLHVPEEHGGSGFGLPEVAVVADELGYSLTTAPFLASVVASGTLVVSGTPTQRKTHLGDMADGTTKPAIGLANGLSISGDRVSGEITGVLGASSATVLLVKVDDDLLIVEPGQAGVLVTPAAAVDPSLGFGTVTLDAVSAAPDAVVPGAAAVALRLLRTLASAEAAGGARASLDMALEYAKVREQFGRVIGGFQAIKHHLADMLAQVEIATAVSWDAARSADGEQAELAAAAAAALAFDAFQQNAQKNIQVLGGIGFTWEHDAHLLLRRAISLRSILAQAGDAGDALYRLASGGAQREYGVDLPPEAEQYRTQAREFLATYRATPEGDRRKLLADTGYLVPHWQPPFGRGAGPVEQLVIQEELPEVEGTDLGITGWVLLTLTQTATPEQIERWVPKSLAGDHIWCQLFSEPNAGSDAAAVQTRGVKVEGGWRLNGQKVWTSGAHLSDFGLATIRTDSQAPKHKGITAMVVDMHAEGVDVRPLRQISGASGFNEVFFDNVFVPDGDVVGEINDGWRVARTTLGNERVTIGGSSRSDADRLLALVKRFASDDPSVRRLVARLIAEEQALQLINLRQVARAVAGSEPGPEGNVTKLLTAEHRQRTTELALQIAGVSATAGADSDVAIEYLSSRSSTIAGGTSEISRNVIAERILGLPRDPLNR